MIAPNTNGQFIPAEGYPLLEVYGTGTGISDCYRPAGFTDPNGDELTTEADKAAYLWAKTDYASGPDASAAVEANFAFLKEGVTLSQAEQATKAAYAFVKGSGHYLTPKPVPVAPTPFAPLGTAIPAPVLVAPVAAPVSEAHAAAVVAVQQTVANVAQTAVSLPPSHPAHSWLSSFFGFLAHNAVPVAAALIAAKNPSLAPAIGAVSEAVAPQG